jgi:hypothetical protein
LESCRSVDYWPTPCKVDKQQVQRPDTHKSNITQRRLSNLQGRKRRQLTHGARNRAGHSIVVQVPAKSTRSSLFRKIPSSSLLFQLTGVEETTAGPQCSESCRLVDCRPTACKIDNNKRPVQANARRLCSNSQELKRRQLAHGVRDRAGQSTLEQEPARERRGNRRKSSDTRTNTPPTLTVHSSHVAPRTCQTNANAKAP